MPCLNYYYYTCKYYSEGFTKTLQGRFTMSAKSAVDAPKYGAGIVNTAGEQPVESESLKARPEKECLQFPTKHD
jgi:hypothetical protein